MFRHLISWALFLLLSSAGFAQVMKPISWKHTVKPTGEEGVVELVFEAVIDKNWYLYSTDFDPDLGPLVTTFTFTSAASYELVGAVVPDHPKKKFDELWGGEYTYFIEKAAFSQKIKLLSSQADIKASVSYQVCSEVDGKCIPLEEEFAIKAGASVSAVKGKEEKGDASPVPVTEGLLSFMLYAFIWGLAAIFTPCVFPMIPLTVSFFTQKAANKQKGRFQALFYGFSIIFIYTLTGAILAPLAGPAFANFLSTHWIPNLLFFIVFVIFALSFFGMFDIVLPSSWVNKPDEQVDKQQGLAGVFFMAFTLVLVSFSCTGPIVGSLLVESAGGALVKPIAGMFAFGMAFGLPFTVFALFPSLLNKMPKSGGWLNAVKVSLGFVELALAFKFLSIVDQVYHWGILDRHVNIAIWIAIALFMTFYFLGWIRLPHDDKTEHVSVPRLLLALASFSFVIYLFPGMFGAPLKAMSGYLPPQTSHGFDLANIIQNQPSYTVAASNPAQKAGSRKFSNLFKMPHGLNGYYDYNEALQAAREAGKPLFIDFTGHGCVNCRKMEDNVWADPQVLSRLKNDYIVVALYVDDRNEVPQSDWVVSTFDGKTKKTIGQINGDLQISKFDNNAQPFYCLLDHNGNKLVEPKAYDLDIQNFVDFLESGKAAFAKQQEGLAAR